MNDDRRLFWNEAVIRKIYSLGHIREGTLFLKTVRQDDSKKRQVVLHFWI